MGFVWTKETNEPKTMKEIYKDILEGSERYLTKMMGKAFAMSGTLPDELDPETTEMVNDALTYWKDSKRQILELVDLQDKRDKKHNEEMSKVQEQLTEISKKLDNLMKKKGE